MEILIYAVLLVGAIIGFRQGAFKQIANFVGVIAGLAIAATLYQQFGDMLADKAGTSSSFGRLIAFVLIVIIVPVILGWVASLLTVFFKKLNINFINRLIGALIGVVSYGLILSIALNLYDFISSNAGFKPQKLSQRPSIYYQVKQATQIVIPDVIIVTDSTEVAHGAEPKFGLRPIVDQAADKINPFKNQDE